MISGGTGREIEAAGRLGSAAGSSERAAAGGLPLLEWKQTGDQGSMESG